MNFSYWEHKTWFSEIDFTIIGSGIVGLSCALELRKKHPKAKIVILDKGMLPQGASTKNAGFACFGSVSEILDDLTHTSEENVIKLVKQRITGLASLRELIGDEAMDYKPLGGYELFTDNISFNECIDSLTQINNLLQPIFNESVYSLKDNSFGFENIKPKVIFNSFEGQIDTGKMMKGLLDLAYKNDITFLNSINVADFEKVGNKVEVRSDKLTFKTQHLFIATNGFSESLGIDKVKPARAQVLITKPIDNLDVKGTFHLDKGYYYFRNIGNRILFGGGRNLDFKGEETFQFGQSEIIQNELERILKTVILPNTSFEIDQKWSGIMGVGNQKSPFIKSISNRVHCGVRLGGMGIAIGTHVGNQLANLID